KPGQRILIHSHIYNALRNLMRFIAELRGATIEVIDLPLSTEASEVVEQRISERLGDDVGLVVIDHITSPTAVTFPIERIVAACRSAQVPVLIDGAHGPGHRPLELTQLNADWYVGNGHKWLGAPRGTAFIWAHENWLNRTEPPVISHGYQSDFSENFMRHGTIDFSAWSTLTATLDWYGRLDRHGAFTHASAMLKDGYQKTVEALGATPITDPDGQSMMAAMLLPKPWTAEQAEPLRRRLSQDFRIINVPIDLPTGELLLRLSAYGYTQASDFDRLIGAFKEIAA
ncbi:MAG: aminotransferase class V-fold PLP-dependent enzyme, partial [Pseudomonadota bacterium]